MVWCSRWRRRPRAAAHGPPPGDVVPKCHICGPLEPTTQSRRKGALLVIWAKWPAGVISGGGRSRFVGPGGWGRRGRVRRPGRQTGPLGATARAAAPAPKRRQGCRRGNPGLASVGGQNAGRIRRDYVARRCSFRPATPPCNVIALMGSAVLPADAGQAIPRVGRVVPQRSGRCRSDLPP